MRVIGALLMTMVVCGSAAGQEQPPVPGGEAEDYLRYLELIRRPVDAPLVYRSLSSLRHVVVDSQHPWAGRIQFDGVGARATRPSFRWFRPEGLLLWNSKFPRGANDGALWAGRGFSGSVTSGAEARWGPLTARLYPIILFHENDEFAVAPVPFADRSYFAYPWFRNIDLPQRFGNNPFVVPDWGQSGIRIDLGRFTAGVGTENLWWGPAFRNAIIMSNAGPGFPHVDLGTGRPVRLGKAGSLEVRLIAGRLSESDYFDADPNTGRRFLNGLTIGFAPRFIPGLTVGATRVLYDRWEEATLSDALLVLTGVFNPGRVDTSGAVVNDSTDQLLSFTARWSFPASGVGVHVEWARNDFSGSLRDLLLEPDHSDAFTLGVEQVVGSDGVGWRLRGEATRVGPTAVSLFRDSPPYYAHSRLQQGYTHRGQMLGAAIGPGGSSQFVSLDRYTGGGRWSFSFERVRYNDDAFFDLKNGVPFNYLMHQVDLTVGISTYRFAGGLDLGGSIELTRRLNQYFERDADTTNLKLTLSLTRRGPNRRSR